MIKPSNIVKNTLRVRRRRAIRNRLNGTTERPRLVVFRSLKHIYAQIIDDTTGKTLVSASSRGKDVEIPKGIKKTEQGFQVGQKLGEISIDAGRLMC